MGRRWSCIIALALFLSALGKCEDIKCIHRDYGKGGTVCVCNATHCDSMEPLGLFPPRQYYMVTSSKDGLRFEMTKRNLGQRAKEKGVQVTINSNVTYQKILGFGGAITDSAGLNIYSLSDATREKLIAAYYADHGLGFNFARVPIAGTDFSTRPYTYDDKAHDIGLKHFELAREDEDYKIPFLKRAMEMSTKNIKLLGAAWTAPPWMKTNKNYNGFGFLREEYYRLWSNYHIKFLEQYKKHRLEFWGISTGNEPLAGFVPFYAFNCMGWTPYSQREWVAKHLGPALENSPFNSTLILAMDDQRYELPWWADIIYGDTKASSYISGIGVHWYADGYVPPLVLDKTHQSHPTKFILPTEACYVKKFWESEAVHLGSWSRGEGYADSIIDDLNHWSAGWIDWNLALNEKGGPNWAKNYVDASIIVNKTSDEFYKQPMYYALGHFSKFIPEGSIRIHIQVHDVTLKATAVRTPDEHVVLVLLNKKPKEVHVSISGAPRGYANFVVPAKSITTVIYRDKKIPSWYL